MDWTAIIVALVGSAATLGAGWLALRGTLAKVHAEAAAARAEQASIGAQVHDIEQSINNRPTPLSDRLDAVGATAEAATLAVSGLATEIRTAVARLDKNHAEGMDAHRRLNERVTSIGDAERQSRHLIDMHIQETAYMLPMMRGLYKKWGDSSEET